MSLREHWDSLPFDASVDARLRRHGRAHLPVLRRQFVRYSTGDYTQVDDGYPARIAAFWGNVATTSPAPAGSTPRWSPRSSRRSTASTPHARYTYLFSGDQYVRYLGADYAHVQPGYPRALAALTPSRGWPRSTRR